MNDDLLDESLLDDTPPPELEVVPRIVTGTPDKSGDIPMPPPLNADLLQEIPSQAPPPLAMDALSELPAEALSEAPRIVLGAEALQEIPAAAPMALPLDALQELPAENGFSYDACPKCAAPKGASALCDQCGTRLVFKTKKKDAADPDAKQRCRECGTANKASRLRCMNCGSRMPSRD